MAAISATLLRQCPSFRPGVAYVLRNALYLQPCARNVAATSLLASRGPGFALPADCGFERLDPDAEPSAAELAAVVDEVYAASTASSAGAMGESDAGVTFAGDGEPLLALETLISTVELLQVRRNGLPMRLVTSGLFGSEVAQRLLGSGALALGDADARRETRIASVSVALNADSPALFERLVGPPNGAAGFGQVCGFISALAEGGAAVECTCVEHQDVDVAATRRLALALGARELRVRPYFPAS